MKFLLDTSIRDMKRRADHPLVVGQLLTPLTRYSDWGGVYAIDNGAFSGLRVNEFKSLLYRQAQSKDRCLFVTVPDMVAAGQRSLELFAERRRWVPDGWRVALVAQDGIENLPIPWRELDCIFIGGGDPWKDSKASMDVVRTAKLLGKHVHVGRVNTTRRYKKFAELGADTCDGSGVARYDWMLDEIMKQQLHQEATLIDFCTD